MNRRSVLSVGERGMLAAPRQSRRAVGHSADRDATAHLPRSPARSARILSGHAAFATTNYVQQFYRDPASRGFDASIDTVAHLLAAAGYRPEGVGYIPEQPPPASRLTYRIESRPSRGLVWSPLDASITLAGASTPLEQWSTNHNMLPSNSWSTPPGGIDAEIVNVGGGTDAELERADVQRQDYLQRIAGRGGRAGPG